MDHYIGQQIIDQLRELNSNLKELIEVQREGKFEQTVEEKYYAALHEMQVVNPNALDQPAAEWETDLGTKKPKEASWEEFNAEKKDN